MNTWVLNFANAIVGVGVLAVPFCFHVCGIGIAVLMILICNVVTRKTCEYLLKSGQMTRKSGYETLAGHLLGPPGKLIAELGIIGLLFGTLVSFQVVIGDLAPVLVSNLFGFPETWGMRAMLMLFSSIGVIPLGLMKNISSLANMNAMSMGFYCIFVIVVVLIAMKNLFNGLWMSHVNFWRPEGIFHCLPILSLAFSCQTQVFVMYEAIPDPSPKAMMAIIDKAIHLVSVIYLLVGFFGYVAFYETGIRGDILANFSTGILSDSIKAGFWISIVISFPLIIFPLRSALHSLLFSRGKNTQHDVISSAADYIPQDRFTAISLLLIGITLIVGILIPHIETVLSVTGAVIGTFLCFVLPAGLFVISSMRAGTPSTTAKVIFVVCAMCMVASTMSVLSGGHASDQSDHNGHPGHEQKIPGKIPVPVDIKKDKLAMPLQVPGAGTQDGKEKTTDNDDPGGNIAAAAQIPVKPAEDHKKDVPKKVEMESTKAAINHDVITAAIGKGDARKLKEVKNEVNNNDDIRVKEKPRETVQNVLIASSNESIGKETTLVPAARAIEVPIKTAARKHGEEEVKSAKKQEADNDKKDVLKQQGDEKNRVKSREMKSIEDIKEINEVKGALKIDGNKLNGSEKVDIAARNIN